jgi:hypothetical protein
MAQPTIFLLLAILLIILIPVAPRLIKLRIKLLTKIKLNGLAGFIERNFKAVVLIAQIVWALLALVLLVLAFA